MRVSSKLVPRQPASAARLSEQHAIAAAAWDVFAGHQPYYHVLSDPRMLDADAQARDEFWASGTRDVRTLMEFAGLSAAGGVSVDFGCGLGRLTRALVLFHMEFRQLKSIPLRRLHASLRAAQLNVRRLVRNRQNGGTFVAVQKA